MTRNFVQLFLFLFLTATAGGQTYSSVHYDTKDGLPSATVYDITQDKDGFIWFGTENGLCRFDGKNFKTYTTRDGLPDNSILKVHGDARGRVYFSPFTHSLYYIENNRIKEFPVPEAYRVDLSGVSLFANKKNAVILCGYINSYILENEQLIPFTDRYRSLPPTVLVGRVYDNTVILGYKDSVYQINDAGDIRTYALQKGTNLIYDDRVQFRRFHIANDSAFRMIGYLPDNRFYWFWNDQFAILDASTGVMSYTFKVSKFSKAFIDNEGSLWITTIGDGVYRYSSFKFVNLDPPEADEIFCFLPRKDGMLAGGDKSVLFNIKRGAGLPSYISADLSNYTRGSSNPVTYLTKRNRVYSLAKDESATFIGTDAFLLREEPGKPTLPRYIHPIKDIDVVGNDLYVCTGYNVVRVQKKTLQTRDTLLYQRSTCGEMYNGHFYMGTLGGLVEIDTATKKITELYKKNPLLGGRIMALKAGSGGELWIASSIAGLLRYRDNQVTQTITEVDGLTSDICTSLSIDGDLVWLGTNKGLNRIAFDGNKPQITRFTSANGLNADFINAVSVMDSSVYVGTGSGVTIFSKNVLSDRSLCLLNILSVSENDSTLPTASSMVFPYSALNIRIDYTAVSFKSAGDITYHYRMHGLEEKWNSTTANFVNFASLPPGDYTFLLNATNKFGVQSETKSLHIVILPPWWQTWSFRIIAAITLIAIVALLFWYNIRSVKKKAAIQREFEARSAALEQKALQAQMNPHFIFNSLNSIQTFILNLDVHGANNYLTNFASLIRLTLENSMQPLISLSSELKYLETYLVLEKLRFREKFRYRIEVDDNIDVYSTTLPGMLLQPYIENSLRHGIQHRKDNHGLILLEVARNAQNEIVYTITDNGVGRQKASELKSRRHIEYQSRGISINEKRIAAINIQFKTNIRVETRDLFDDAGLPAGTSVQVIIPYLEK